MMPVLPLNERKACFGCAKAKRTCDKQTPSCRRCSDKEIERQYPRIKRYRRVPPASASRERGSLGPVNVPDAHAAVIDLYSLESLPPLSNLQNINCSETTTYSYRVWFVEPHTWLIENTGLSNCHLTFGIDPVSTVHANHKSWKSSVTGWLRQWVEKGCNPFVHRHLYSRQGLPQCLQDAWTTLTAYFSMTSRNEHLVMQIVEARASGLLQAQIHDDNSFMAVPGLHTVEHLARV